MSAAFLKLPTNLSSQLSPGDTGKALSIEKSHHDILLNEIIQLRLNGGSGLGGLCRPQSLATMTPPVMTAQDRSARGVERVESYLEGEKISCFVVGGEPRMCFPQLLSTVFRDVTLPQMNQGMKELNIHNSVATPSQLEVLKLTGVLPMSAANCGLITKTDAERLASYLLHSRRSHPRLPSVGEEKAEKQRSTGIPVAHDCFGGARGLLFLELYQSPSAECIECSSCRLLLATDKFVVHSHESERVVCHWGFDSANWRHYMELQEEFRSSEEKRSLLMDAKIRFDPSNPVTAQNLLHSAMVQLPGELIDKSNNLLKRKAEEGLGYAEGGNGKRAHMDPLLLSSPSPFGLYDPGLLNYYQTVLRYQQLLNSSQLGGIAPFPPSLPPTPNPLLRPGNLPGLLNNNNVLSLLSGKGGPNSSGALKSDNKCPTPVLGGGGGSSKAAIAAAGLLALSGGAEEGSEGSSSEKSNEHHQRAPSSSNHTQGSSPEESKSNQQSKGRRTPGTSATSSTCSNAESPSYSDPLPAKVLHKSRGGFHASEPLKKHLLHQFARENQKRTLSETATEARPLSESVGSSSSLESEDETSLDYLLSKLIQDPVALQHVRSKIAESQKSLELKIDSLSTQNNILQQEIAYMRNKQSLMGKRPSGNLLIGNIS